MLADWIYNNPTWLTGALIIAFFVLISCGGLLLVHRLVPVRLRRSHNDIVGFTIAIVGVVYAVLLAFIAVTTWETFRKVDDVVANEANYVGDVFRNTAGLPDNLATQMRAHLRDYVDAVMTHEWPAQRAGTLNTTTLQKGWELLARAHGEIAEFRPADAGEAVLQGQALRTLNSLYDARRGRILAAHEHVASAVWWIIALGTMITVGFTYLFGTLNLRMHMVITGMVAASLAIVIVLIVALDRPFRGSLSISDEPFRAVKSDFDAAPAR